MGSTRCRALQGFAELCRVSRGPGKSRLRLVSLLSLPLSLFVLSRPSRVGELSNQAKGNLREAVEGNSGIKVLEDAELTNLWTLETFVCLLVVEGTGRVLVRGGGGGGDSDS
jgi:hypothetical protein